MYIIEYTDEPVMVLDVRYVLRMLSEEVREKCQVRFLNLSGIVWKSRRSFLPTHDGPITNSRISRQKSRGIADEKVRAMKYYDDLIPTEEWKNGGC